jgi:hypothetical protein
LFLLYFYKYKGSVESKALALGVFFSLLAVFEVTVMLFPEAEANDGRIKLTCPGLIFNRLILNKFFNH